MGPKGPFGRLKTPKSSHGDEAAGFRGLHMPVDMWGAHAQPVDPVEHSDK